MNRLNPRFLRHWSKSDLNCCSYFCSTKASRSASRFSLSCLARSLSRDCRSSAVSWPPVIAAAATQYSALSPSNNSRNLRHTHTLARKQNKVSPRGRRDDMPPADGGKNRGGSTAVCGRVHSPHISGGRGWLSYRQPACPGSCSKGQTDGRTEGRITLFQNAPYGGGHNKQANTRLTNTITFSFISSFRY